MVYALITVYNPTKPIWDNIRAVAGQVDRVCICDNSDCAQTPSLPENARYWAFGENLGISQAYNRVLTDPSVPWQDGDYLLFLDQDSRCSETHVRDLLSIYETLTAQGHRVGSLGPAIFNTCRGAVEFPRMKTPLETGVYTVSGIITSSMLCTYGNLRSVGFWNEKVFLDMADWDLCWRLRKAGLLCCMAEDVVLEHTLGIGEKKIGPMRLRVGQPVREYYQIRDGLQLMIASYTPLKYRIRFLANLLIRSPLHLMFLDSRKERLHYISMGLRDTFRGRKGALTE